jgi:hypothetical protein
MMPSFRTAMLAALAALGASLVLRSLSGRWALDPAAALRIRMVSAVRLLLTIAAVLLVLVQVMLAGGALPLPAQVFLWVVGGLLVFPWLGNAVAGLWFLSRLTDAELGDVIVACGHQGRLRGFGVSRLELLADGGRLVFLPYLSVVREPLSVARRNESVGSRLVLERPEWTEHSLRFLRQAAILAPYRDVTAPVSVSLSGSTTAHVELALVRPDAEGPMLRFLEGALERHARALRG